MQNIKTFIRMYKQLVAILNKKQRRQAIVVAIMAIFSALFETLGVSVVLPFVLAMLQPEQLMENQYIKPVLAILNVTEVAHVLIITAFLIIIVYIAKNAFILFFNYIHCLGSLHYCFLSFEREFFPRLRVLLLF